MPARSVDYGGERFYLQSTGRYYSSGDTKAPNRLLHRRIWVDAYGVIPDGCEVHHKDHDWTNNALDNLKLRHSGEHQRAHVTAWWKDPIIGPKYRAALEVMREKAKAWHSSPEGRAWHRQHSKDQWKTRKLGDKACAVCGGVFQTLCAGRASVRFCSKSCRQHDSYRRAVAHRACEMCGGAFVCNKYRATRFCGHGCANRHRHLK